MDLSIIVPAHNEEDRIGPMLDAYLPFFAARYRDRVEFIVVINGTTDDTASVVAAREKDYPQLRHIVEPRPIGKGLAVIEGFEQARGELVGYVDADGASPPEAFQDLIDQIGDADAIIASRWRPGARISPRQPLHRRLTSRVFNLLTRILFGFHFTDTQCGAKLLKRPALLAVLPDLGRSRWAFDVVLLFQLRLAGYSVKEIPTTWQDILGSKLDVTEASKEMVLALIRLRLVYSPFVGIVRFYDRRLRKYHLLE